MIQQYPNVYGHPETVLRVDHVANDPTLYVENCPLGIAITGPKCQVKVGLTCYDVVDIGAYPHLDWVVVPGTEDTDDADYVAGTPVYVPITRGAFEDIRARSYITRTDETLSNPNSAPLDDVSLHEIGTRLHGDLDGVDENQHHKRLHRHDNVNDGVDLFPRALYTDELRLRGVVEIPTLSASQNNWNPTDGMGYNVWLLSASTPVNITGLAIGTSLRGRYLILINVGTSDITLVHNSSLSLFANRFKISGGANKVLGAGHGIAQCIYAGAPSLEQWRIW